MPLGVKVGTWGWGGMEMGIQLLLAITLATNGPDAIRENCARAAAEQHGVARHNL